MDSIREWLNGGRNYAVGVALYNAHGDDAALKLALAQGESEYRKQRLLDALKEICGRMNKSAGTDAPKVAGGGHEPVPSSSTPSPAIAGTPPNNRGRAEIIKIDRYRPEQADHSKDPYYEQWHPLYKEMMTLCSRLRMFADDRERGAAAFRILELERACRYYWHRRDYYQKTGTHMPDDSGRPDMVTDPNALKARQMTLRTYITKYKKKLDIDPHNIKAREKLDQYTAEKDVIEQKLEEK